MSFEETAPDLISNVRSLGFDLQKLIDQKKIVIDHVRVERNEIQETGEYDLELSAFIRLDERRQGVKAKTGRARHDGILALRDCPIKLIIRSELRRLFSGLLDHNLAGVHHRRTRWLRTDTDAARFGRIRRRLRHPARSSFRDQLSTRAVVRRGEVPRLATARRSTSIPSSSANMV